MEIDELLGYLGVIAARGSNAANRLSATLLK